QVTFLVDGRVGLTRAAAALWDQLKLAAEVAGIRAERIPITSVNDIEAAFETPAMARSQAFVSGANGLFLGSEARPAQLAVQHRLAGATNLRSFAAAGLLFHYGPNETVIARRSAVYVDKILKGASAGDLPVEQPTVYDLGVNVKTLQALG